MNKKNWLPTIFLPLITIGVIFLISTAIHRNLAGVGGLLYKPNSEDAFRYATAHALEKMVAGHTGDYWHCGPAESHDWYNLRIVEQGNNRFLVIGATKAVNRYCVYDVSYFVATMVYDLSDRRWRIVGDIYFSNPCVTIIPQEGECISSKWSYGWEPDKNWVPHFDIGISQPNWEIGKETGTPQTYQPLPTIGANITITPITYTEGENITNTPKTFDSASDKLLLSDNFEDISQSSTNWTPITGEWKIIGGNYVCVANGKSLAGDPSWNDYTYTLNIMGKEVIDKVIVFRYKDDTLGYGIDFRSDPYNDLVLVKNGKILQSVKINNYNEIWYEVKITVVSRLIKVYVNGDLLINYQDNEDPVLSGKIGLGAMLSSTYGSSVYFDDVKVELYSPK